MSFSIQTNVSSLVAQENLRVNNEFQNRTIERLTSGFRINSSGDDAAGLAIANKFRSDIAELSQGVRNANDGISQLQIIDGGLNNISKILDRLKTLATQSASTTFSGDRSIVNSEFKDLVAEIDRQSKNIKLDQGGTYNSRISVYIGGATSSASANARVDVDLSGNTNAVDSGSLGIAGASVADGGNISLNGAANKDLSAASTVLLASGGSQTFTLNYVNDLNQAAAATITVTGDSDGLSTEEALGQLNKQLGAYGVNASLNADGYLQFSGGVPFSVTSTATTADSLTVNAQAATYDNAAMYHFDGVTANAASDNAGEKLQFGKGGETVTVTFATNTAATSKVNQINTLTAALGIKAVVNASGGVSIASSSDFTLVKLADATTVTQRGFGTSTLGMLTLTDADMSTSSTGNAVSALKLISDAVSVLGAVQGVVGAGQNKLSYAIQLAQSQISSFSAAESRIRDADVAAEAANLTKAQVLQQASIAAMAQANSAPQAVLSLLKG